MNHQPDALSQTSVHRPLTARNLEDFVLCPQKYLLSLFITRAQSRRFIGGPAALHQALRSAIVECYRSGGPGQVPLATFLKLFEEHWQGNLCADSLEEQQLHARGRKMLTAYHQDHHDKPNCAIASDVRLEAEIEGQRFVAVADRVDRDDEGTITLLRYKSTSSPPGPSQLAKDISAGLLLLLGREHYAPASCHSAIYALRPGRLTVAAIDEPQLGRLRQRIGQLATTIRTAQNFPTNAGTHCRWCRSRTQCPAWATAHYRPEESQ